MASRVLRSRKPAVVAAVGFSCLLARMSADAVHADNEKVKPKNLKDQRIVILGGGSAGIGLSAILLKDGAKNVTVIEPSSQHYYQPLYTLVGGGIKNVEESVKPTKEVMPDGVTWLQLPASNVLPDENAVVLSSGAKVPYDYLVVCPGMQINWDGIPGLVDALKDPSSGVVSVYNYEFAAKTAKVFKDFKGGRAIFTVPTTPVKCPGAVQKIMWLVEDNLSELPDKSIRQRSSLELWTGADVIFGVKKYADMLNEEKAQRGIVTSYKQSLIAVDGKRKIATFKNLTTGEVTEQAYDVLHVTPPMSGVDFLKSNPIANELGYVLVNQNTLQSTKYNNIFALGDAAGTPNSKTIAAITAQGPVVAHNLIKEIEGKELDGYYNGYASCPLTVRKNKCILAEFGYGGKIMETFDRETGKFPYYFLGQDKYYIFSHFKKTLFPFVYWNAWLKGRWYGSNGPFRPDVTEVKK